MACVPRDLGVAYYVKGEDNQSLLTSQLGPEKESDITFPMTVRFRGEFSDFLADACICYCMSIGHFFLYRDGAR